MNLEKGKAPAPSRGFMPLLAGGLASMLATAALAKTVPFAGGQFATATRDVSGKGGELAENVTIRSLRMGDRTIRLDDGRFRAPIQVRVATGESAMPSADSASLAFTPDLPATPGMTALDAMSGADLGRMILTDGSKPTRVQVFLAMQERDDDAFADDNWPELVLVGSPTGGAVRVTPILDGTPDLPATLVFGTPHDVPASAFAKGLLPLRIDYNGRKAPQALAAVGLDLSGDLGVKPGQTVVGYQIDVSAGEPMPLKVIASGQVEFGAYANFADASPVLTRAALGQFAVSNPGLDAAEDQLTSIVGPVFIGSGKSETTMQMGDAAGMNQPAGPNFTAPELEGFQNTGSTAFNTPPVFPAIPAPGVSMLVGLAGSVLLNRRRRD